MYLCPHQDGFRTKEKMWALTRVFGGLARRRLQGMTPLSPTLTKQMKQLALTKGPFNVVFIGAGSACSLR